MLKKQSYLSPQGEKAVKSEVDKLAANQKKQVEEFKKALKEFEDQMRYLRLGFDMAKRAMQALNKFKPKPPKGYKPKRVKNNNYIW